MPDVEILSRIQFALTISFHYIFPPLSIGLGLMMVFMEGAYLWTRQQVFRDMSKFWTRVFGLIFAMGVASGIVMEFQFGMNWSDYSRYVGDVFGSALAAEGIFAFFLESGFLALLLFGWDHIGPRLHFFSTLMVCLGSHFSAVWIVVANSWMQTPAGHKVVEHTIGSATFQRAEIVDFWAMVFNPSAMTRLTHTILGCWLAGIFLVLSVSAFYLLRGKHEAFAKMGLRFGLVAAAVVSLLQAVAGSWSADIVVKHQPSKLAAMEGVFETKEYTPLYLFGWVDTTSEKVTGVAVPGALSFLAYRELQKPVPGFDTIKNPRTGKPLKKEEWPPVQAVFQAYHLMIAIGMALIGLSWAGVFLWWRGWIFDVGNWITRVYLSVLTVSVLAPMIANHAGWFTAELGRQPWIVWPTDGNPGMLTSEGVSRVVHADQVLASVIGFTLIYALLFALFIYLLTEKILKGPEDSAAGEAEQSESSSTRFESVATGAGGALAGRADAEAESKAKAGDKAKGDEGGAE